MRVIIEPNYDRMSKWAADYVAKRIIEAQPTAEKPFKLGFPTGSSPLGLYKELVRKYEAGELSFENVITFNMDEYVHIDENHPESYHSFMWTNFFSHINIKKENVHILNGNAPDLVKECEEYEEAIFDAGGIDLFLGGVGEDGHLAFNEPFSSLNSRTRVVTLTEDTIIVNSRFFGGDVNLVPKKAMSVGVGTVCSAKEVLILALGSRKARVVREAIEGGVSHYVTLSALQLHEKGTVVLDEAAAGELKVNSYRYFKAVEAAMNKQ